MMKGKGGRKGSSVVGTPQKKEKEERRHAHVVHTSPPPNHITACKHARARIETEAGRRKWDTCLAYLLQMHRRNKKENVAGRRGGDIKFCVICTI